MNEQKYDNQALTEYLLGALPEPEVERFDELGFTDEDFADALKAAENNLIDAYINVELSGRTLKIFESHYFASPLRREKINFARAFQSFAARDQRAPGEDKLMVADSNFKRGFAGFLSAINIFAAPNLARLSLAAVGLILTALGGFWIINRALNNSRESDWQARNSGANSAEQSRTRKDDFGNGK